MLGMEETIKYICAICGNTAKAGKNIKHDVEKHEEFYKKEVRWLVENLGWKEALEHIEINGRQATVNDMETIEEWLKS